MTKRMVFEHTTEPFKPDYDTQAVLVEEQQRMAKRIEELEALAERQTARINDAVLAEREACAAKAEQVGQYKNHIGIAAAIRARGQA